MIFHQLQNDANFVRRTSQCVYTCTPFKVTCRRLGKNLPILNWCRKFGEVQNPEFFTFGKFLHSPSVFLARGLASRCLQAADSLPIFHVNRAHQEDIREQSAYIFRCIYPNVIINYRVIHKSLRDFRTRLRNNQDRHGRKEHINRQRISPSFFGNRGFGVLPGSTDKGSREEKWRSQ